MPINSPELKQACFDGDLETVRGLLNAGADPNSRDQYGSGTLLTFHPEVIEVLLSRGADPEAQTNESGGPVLLGLTHGDHLDCIRLLLEAGANPNRACSVTGETALHGAVTSNELDRMQLVKILLEYGANPNSKTTPGVISQAFWRDARTRGETPLHRAAAYLPIEVIKMLIEAGADTTIRDINGDSPLSWASWHLRERAVIDLLNDDGNGNRIA